MASTQGCAGSIDNDPNHRYMRWPAGPVRIAKLFQTVQVSYAMSTSSFGRYSCAVETMLIWQQRRMQQRCLKGLYNAHLASRLMCGSVAAIRDVGCLALRALALPTRRSKSKFWHCVIKREAKCGPESGANLDLLFESRFWKRWFNLYLMNVCRVWRS